MFKSYHALGLTVELYLDQSNYMLRRLSKSAGVRLVVHDAELAPLPDEYGIDLQPNTASSISVKMVNYAQSNVYFFT